MSSHALEPLSHKQQNNDKACQHNRLVEDVPDSSATNAGMVKCVECGTVIADPHVRRKNTEPSRLG